MDSRHDDTTIERDLLTTQHEHAESERYKLMEAYYANAIESRRATVDASLEDGKR